MEKYLHRTLGKVAETLEWSIAEGDYDEIICTTLLEYGVNDWSGATEMLKLRMLGAYFALDAACISLSQMFDLKSGDDTLTLSQLYEQTAQRLESVYEDCDQRGYFSASGAPTSWTIRTGPVYHLDDYYNH